MSQYYRPQGFTLLPEVTKNLLIINGIFFFASFVLLNRFDIDLNDLLGLHYWGAEKFRPSQFVTYLFLHGNLQHIVYNMFALWMFGYAVENYWGGKKFLTYYLVCGLGAALTHYAIFYFESRESLALFSAFMEQPGEPALQELINKVGGKSPEIMMRVQVFIEEYNQKFAVNPAEALEFAKEFAAQLRVDYLNEPVVVGASGAVFGLLLAFGMLFPNSVIYIYFLFPLKAKYFVIIYGALEFFSGIANRGMDNVAHFAHLGGMLFGFLLIMLWRRRPPGRDFYL